MPFGGDDGFLASAYDLNPVMAELGQKALKRDGYEVMILGDENAKLT
jgi:hypothetical protein